MAALLAIDGAAQSAPDPWLILADGTAGTINSKTTRADLVRSFGAANVMDRDVDIGEGETEPGTVVFSKEPERSIDILWKDPATKRAPSLIHVR